MYGAEAVILNLSRMLNESGHHSLLATFANSSHPNLEFHHRALQEGLESHLIACKGQLDFSVARQIHQLASQTHADVVHAHGYKADLYTCLALRRSRVPFVSTCHNWLDDDLAVYLYGVLDRWVLRRFHAVVAVSDEVLQRLQLAGVAPDHLFKIKNGIDVRPFLSALPSLRSGAATGSNNPNIPVPIVGLIGRLSQEKGVDIFLRAAARVVKALPQTQFVVVGEGPDRDALLALIAELHLEQNVRLLGRRDDMPSVYASLDILVSSSRKEGLPMAILEGMASRLALVATPVGEIPSVITDGEIGVLVPIEDVDALADAILALLRHPERRAQLGLAARRRIEAEFSAERMAADYLRMYTAACNRVRPGQP